MAADTIYISEEIPDALWYDGRGYISAGLVEGSPTVDKDSLVDQALDTLDHAYDTSDPYLAEWTPCQNAVTKHVNGLRDSHYIDTNDVDTYAVIYTAPTGEPGELRVWQSGNDHVGLYVTKDTSGFHVQLNLYTNIQIESSRAIRLNGDESAYIGEDSSQGTLTADNVGTEVACRFLPDSHSPGDTYA